jgi:hypothetical protein
MKKDIKTSELSTTTNHAIHHHSEMVISQLHSQGDRHGFESYVLPADRCQTGLFNKHFVPRPQNGPLDMALTVFHGRAPELFASGKIITYCRTSDADLAIHCISSVPTLTMTPGRSSRIIDASDARRGALCALGPGGICNKLPECWAEYTRMILKSPSFNQRSAGVILSRKTKADAENCESPLYIGTGRSGGGEQGTDATKLESDGKNYVSWSEDRVGACKSKLEIQ